MAARVSSVRASGLLRAEKIAGRPDLSMSTYLKGNGWGSVFVCSLQCSCKIQTNKCEFISRDTPKESKTADLLAKPRNAFMWMTGFIVRAGGPPKTSPSSALSAERHQTEHNHNSLYSQRHSSWVPTDRPTNRTTTTTTTTVRGGGNDGVISKLILLN